MRGFRMLSLDEPDELKGGSRAPSEDLELGN